MKSNLHKKKYTQKHLNSAKIYFYNTTKKNLTAFINIIKENMIYNFFAQQLKLRSVKHAYVHE